MLEQLNRLLKMDVEEIISSEHSLTLINIYSKLYLNGGQPKTCAASQRKYYANLKKDYKMAKEKLKRTCIPNWEGRKYIPGVFKKGVLVAGHLHIMGASLTDEKAKELLKQRALKEKDFIRLPGEKVEEVEYTEKDILDVIEADGFKEALKIAKSLDLVKGNPNKENVFGALKDYLSDEEL
jgi:hypothetical protein